MSDRKCLENERILQALAGTMGCNSLCSTLFRFHWVCVQPLAVSVDKTSVWSLILCTPRVLHVANLPYYEQISFHQEKKWSSSKSFGGSSACSFRCDLYKHIYKPYWPHTSHTDPWKVPLQPNATQGLSTSASTLLGFRLKLLLGSSTAQPKLLVSNMSNLKYQSGTNNGPCSTFECQNWSGFKTKSPKRCFWASVCVCAKAQLPSTSQEIPRVSVKRFCPKPARAGLGNGAWGTRDICDAGSSASDGLKWRNGNRGKRVKHVETGETTCCSCCCCCNLVTSGPMLDP